MRRAMPVKSMMQLRRRLKVKLNSCEVRVRARVYLCDVCRSS